MSETNNSEKSKGYLESIVNGTNWVALGVVLFAVVGLICVVFNLLTKTEENNAPKEIVIKYEITVDKVSLKNAKDSTTLRVKSLDENNKKILSEINSSVDAQYKRMESILSVQEDRSRLFSYGAGFLAILVAIATFFGFKSINEMKKSTIEAAEYEAKKVAEDEAKKVAKEEAKKTSTKVSKAEINKQIESIKDDLEISLRTSLVYENKKEVEASINAKTEEFEKLKTVAEDLIAKLQVIFDREIVKNSEDEPKDPPQGNVSPSDPPNPGIVNSEDKNNEKGNDEVGFK